MSHPLAGGFAALAVVLAVLALVQYSRVRERLVRVELRRYSSNQVRSLVRAVREGKLPDDGGLASLAVDYARQVTNNYPLRVSYAPYSLGAAFTAGVAVADFVGLNQLVFAAVMLILIGLNIRAAGCPCGRPVTARRTRGIADAG